jgi:hypothetical protein
MTISACTPTSRGAGLGSGTDGCAGNGRAGNGGSVNGEAANDWAAGSRESEPLMLNSLNGNVAPPLK